VTELADAARRRHLDGMPTRARTPRSSVPIELARRHLDAVIERTGCACRRHLDGVTEVATPLGADIWTACSNVPVDAACRRHLDGVIELADAARRRHLDGVIELVRFAASHSVRLLSIVRHDCRDAGCWGADRRDAGCWDVGSRESLSGSSASSGVQPGWGRFGLPPHTCPLSTARSSS
jgi:hypothetical protein